MWNYSGLSDRSSLQKLWLDHINLPLNHPLWATLPYLRWKMFPAGYYHHRNAGWRMFSHNWNSPRTWCCRLGRDPWSPPSVGGRGKALVDGEHASNSFKVTATSGELWGWKVTATTLPQLGLDLTLNDIWRRVGSLSLMCQGTLTLMPLRGNVVYQTKRLNQAEWHVRVTDPHSNGNWPLGPSHLHWPADTHSQLIPLYSNWPVALVTEVRN